MQTQIQRMKEWLDNGGADVTHFFSGVVGVLDDHKKRLAALEGKAVGPEGKLATFRMPWSLKEALKKPPL